MQQVFTECVSCITHELYTGKGCMGGRLAAWFACSLPPSLPTMPSLPGRPPGERVEVSLALHWIMPAGGRYPFPEELGSPSGARSTKLEVLYLFCSSGSFCLEEKLPENVVLGNSWKQTPECRCILVKRKPRKHLHRCGWHRRSWSHFICHCLILAEIITDIWLSKYEVNRKVSSYMWYYK